MKILAGRKTDLVVEKVGDGLVIYQDGTPVESGTVVQIAARIAKLVRAAVVDEFGEEAGE